MMTITEKVKILDMTKEGQTFAAIARHFGVNESTIRYIKKEESSIRKTAAITLNKSAKRVVTSRNKTIVLMEAALAVWIADCRNKNIALDTKIITTKAKSLYEIFAATDSDNNQGEDDTPSGVQPKKRFSASKGWFQKFQKRYGLKSVYLHGKAASADRNATETCANESFKEIIHGGECGSEQVFNMDKTDLFRKRMPCRTFLFKDEAKPALFKAHKDHLTLLMCSNAAGFLLKSALIYKSKNPRALKYKNKNLLTEQAGWTSERLFQIFSLSKQLKEQSKQWDDDIIRSEEFCNKIDEIMIPYKFLLDQEEKRQHQLPITMFFQPLKKEPVNAAAMIESMDEAKVDAPCKEKVFEPSEEEVVAS